MIKKLLWAVFLIPCICEYSYAQNTKDDENASLGAHPVFFIDSVRVSDLKNLNPNDLSLASQYKGKEAKDILGDEGKDGVVYFETKAFCRKRYWRYFKSKSVDYAKLIPTPESDTTVQYILNGKIQQGNFFGGLAVINNEVFKSIQVIDKEALIKNYGIQNKQYGVIIISDIPKNVIHNE